MHRVHALERSHDPGEAGERMSDGDRDSYEVLAVKLGLATRALTGQADIDHQSLRCACAMAQDRVNVALFLGDMVREPCETYGGDIHAKDINVAGQQAKTCQFKQAGDWRAWCWPCKASYIIDCGVRK